jgi:hypothetical protein
MSYIKLHGYFTKSIPDGIATGTVSSTVVLKNGDTVEIPLPFVPTSDTVGVAPNFELSGDAGIRLDFTRWIPVRTGTDLTAGFPMYFTDQALAVKIGRAFEDDPTTSWRDPAEVIQAWVQTWLAANLPAVSDRTASDDGEVS